MATTPVQVSIPAGYSGAKIELYPYASDTIANGAGGDTLVEKTNCKGLYSADVTESISGWHNACIKDAVGATIAHYHVYLRDTTAIHRCEEAPAKMYDGTEYAQSQLANVPHGGTAATLRLGGSTSTPAFYVTNSGGPAGQFESVGGNGGGLLLVGAGTGDGLRAIGGASGDGISGEGGSSNGYGIVGVGQVLGGIGGIGSANNAHGILAAGSGTGVGIQAAGGATGHGLHAIGGATSGDGLRASATAGNGSGINAIKHGTGQDIDGTLERVTTADTVTNRVTANTDQIAGSGPAADRHKKAMLVVSVGVVTTGGSTTSVPTSSVTPTVTVANQYKDRVMIFNDDTTTAALRGQQAEIDSNTSGGVFTLRAALTTAVADTDTFQIY